MDDMTAYRVTGVNKDQLARGYLTITIDENGIDDPQDINDLALVNLDTKQVFYRDVEWRYIGRAYQPIKDDQKGRYRIIRIIIHTDLPIV